MRRTFRNLALVELPTANHFIQEDAPEEISQMLLICGGIPGQEGCACWSCSFVDG
jgi:hypothetical protein